MTTTSGTTPDWDAELQVYEPHRAGLPKLWPYFRDLFSRMAFAREFSRSGIKAAHTETVFGQLWLVLNPLLLALVYFILVRIISKQGGLDRLEHIVSGIFVYYYFSGAVGQGAGSVVGAGKLILNMAFPRLLMPVAAVRTAFFRFLPTVPVLLVIHAFAGGGWSWKQLYAVYFLVMLTAFSLGLTALVATLQVYFRDTASFLPYFLRIWLYLSPVLWYASEAPEKFKNLMFLNPLFSMIGGWNDLILSGDIPPMSLWIGAFVWAAIALVAGSLYFISRERDFAVRI